MNQKLKNKRGLTLIALVVTIVVLLILAGVSISLILDNNGIIQKSKDAKREYGQARANEQADLDKVDSWIDNVLNAPDVVIILNLKILILLIRGRLYVLRILIL